jgi:hypothetical protein
MVSDLLVFLRGQDLHRATRLGTIDGVVRGLVSIFVEAQAEPG